jgi:Amt family ammonium transporter
MLIFQPIIAKAFGWGAAMTGAWLGGTIDTTGAVVAAGAIAGPEAMSVAVVVKMAQNVLIGAAAFLLAIWFTFSYLPIAHMVWFWDGPDAIKDAASLATVTNNAGWLWAKGALDFAGGTVVHINAGVAGLVGALVLGKRVGYGRESMAPHSLTLTMVGAALLWVGWFALMLVQT